MYIFLSEVCLENEQEYKIIWIILECFDKLFVLVKNSITKLISNMRDASSPKTKAGVHSFFHVHSFVVLFS